MRSGFLGGGIGPRAIARRAVAADWWTVAGQTCVAAYKPIGAADLATSYINLANPGVNDAFAGAAPDFTAGGWYSQYGNRYLRTGIVAESSWTIICRFSGAGGGYKFGSWETAGTIIQGTANNTFWNGTTPLTAGVAVAAGTVAIAGNTAYIDGVAVGTITGLANTGLELWIMGLNASGAPDQRFAGTVAALVIYDSTLTGPEVADKHAALLALA